MLYDLVVDSEFRDWIPGVPQMTDAELERQVIRDGGPKDPIRYWETGGRKIVVDGHRRYALCKQHKLPYEEKEEKFSDRESVKAWMDEWSIGRRNLLPNQFAMILARMCDRANQKKDAGTRLNVAQNVAAAAGVTPRTVYRAQNYAEAMRSLPDDIRQRLESGEIKAPASAVIELASYGEIHQRAILAQFDSGCEGKGSLSRLLRGEDGEEETEDDPLDRKTDGEDLDGTVPFDVAAISDTLSPDEETPRPPRRKRTREGTHSKPASTKPSSKPIIEHFNDAQRMLAKVSSQLDSLRGMTRGDLARYNACRARVKDLSDEIENWSKEAA